MIDPKALLADLQKQVKALEADLKTNEDDIAKLRIEWEHARDAERIAATFEAWLGDRVTQVAVAWVLATVFVRFSEDNGLIADAFIAGLGERTAQARERQQAYFQIEANRHKTDRAWLGEAFKEMSKSPVARGLFAEHNPMWSITPSHEATRALIEFWRNVGADGGLIRDFTDPEWNTRFLGDLYQDLSEAARKTYALLQTPEFVEEFILKYTLDPAIEEFGLEPAPPYGHDELPRLLRLIDPACGSGHFLLGAFHRILKAWEDERPGADRRELVANALRSVHGVDKNPFAVAIARFRLLIAAMKVADVKRLDERVEFPRLNIAVGDSLLHGMGAPGIQGKLEDEREARAYTYQSEDINDYIDSVQMLEVGTYHVVVANPPYINVSDPQENQNYRKAYKSCSGKYALSIPFAERVFQLAIRGAQDGAQAGFTGQITSNSFMKREFGDKLIEEYFPNIDLTHIIDTSGVYLLGFGTPTVVLLGRRRYARTGSVIRAVLGIQAEPGIPEDPAQGLVWQAIVCQVDVPGSESAWVSVADLPRASFARHPWSLSGGGAGAVVEVIERAGSRRLREIAGSIGITSFTLEDDLYILPEPAALRHRIPRAWIRRMVLGDGLRDWSEAAFDCALFPYDASFVPVDVEGEPELLKIMWPCKTSIANNILFGRKTKIEGGLKWSEYGRLTSNKLRTPLSITFAEIATGNHFILDRGGKVFNRSAPVIKLPAGADEGDHLPLLRVLNSSTGCFWLKQVCQPKGGSGIGRGVQDEAWEERYVFNATRLEEFPVPAVQNLNFVGELDSLARRLEGVDPSALCADGIPAPERLDAARAEHRYLRGRMIALQEELDWDVYRSYGLLTDQEAADLVAIPGGVPELNLGERAFEIVLARQMRDGGLETQWFERHQSEPITDVPAHWPDEYRAVVERRIEFIGRNRNIGLIERPECKRRWQSKPWEDREKKALTNWLLDRCEERELWFGADGQQSLPLTVNRLADLLREDADVVSVARLLKNDPDADLAKVLAEIIADEHVPYLARLRYKSEGLLKRALWERTWDLQREEDATGQRLDIPVPPKYQNTDFQRPSYWRNRGKLDVPKERFISYPRASPDSDDSLLLGWAGWDHREQAQALYGLIEERQNTDGWGTDRVTPLIKGLAEVMPWVRQWHNETDPVFGQSPADALDGYLASQRERHGITE